MTIFNGANLAALWKSSTYMFGVSSTPGGKALRRPPILRNAALFLFFMLSLMYAAAGIETWLGVSSDAAVYPLKTKYEDSKPLFGRRINQTLCDEWNSSGNPYLCGLIRGCVNSSFRSMHLSLKELSIQEWRKPSGECPDYSRLQWYLCFQRYCVDG